MNSSLPRILLAEDNEADVYMIQKALATYLGQVELQVFNNGEAAMRLVDRVLRGVEVLPDLALIDLNLPRFDGLEILQRLREVPGREKLLVIVVTSSDAPQDRKDALEMGADCYFRKSSDLAQFMEIGTVVRNLLAQRASEDIAAKSAGVANDV